jgi:hypothetical protein
MARQMESGDRSAPNIVQNVDRIKRKNDHAAESTV